MRSAKFVARMMPWSGFYRIEPAAALEPDGTPLLNFRQLLEALDTRPRLTLRVCC